MPIVDPAMYIKRFAAKLDLGSKTNAVCMTALKVMGGGHERAGGSVDGWMMDGWMMDGWMDGWMDKWIDRWIDDPW